MAGGPAARRAAIARRDPTNEDLLEVGEWLTERFDKYNVWVVLMPNNQFDKPFVRGLEISPDWRIVFMNNKQKLFVNVRSEKGRALYEGVFTGATKYPDEFSENLTVGHNLLLFNDADRRQQGLDRVFKAFELNPSPAPMLTLLLLASRYGELRIQIDEFCVDYATKFEKNKSDYVGQDGYNLRLEAARLALLRLQQLGKLQGNTEAAQTCSDQMKQYVRERNAISDRKRW